MSTAVIIPINRFEGKVKIPASKSYSQRALALALISRKKTIIRNLGNSDDELAALAILKDFEKLIYSNENSIEITNQLGSKQNSIEKVISFGESGLATRMFTPILTNFQFPIKLIGNGSVVNRPMDFFTEVFEKLNVKFISNNGKLPFHISDSLQPKSLILDGSLSSQFITGIIYGYVASPLLRKETLEIKNLKSRPYVELSLEVLERFGVELTLSNDTIHFDGPYELNNCNISIEGDWSSASFLLVAAALYGEISIENLNLDSKQADKAILEVLILFGAEISMENATINVRKKYNNAFEFDATDCPDLFPPLAVLAANANGISKIKGISRLKHKESDRALVLKKEFEKLGVKIELDSETDEMIIYPTSKVLSGKIHGNNDHRIVMAATILALKTEKEISIEGAEAISKSFPDFFQILNTCLDQKVVLKD